MDSISNLRIPTDIEYDVAQAISQWSVELLTPEVFIARPLFTRMVDVLMIDTKSTLFSYSDIEISFHLNACNTLEYWMLVTNLGSCAIYNGSPDKASYPTDECGDPYQGDPSFSQRLVKIDQLLRRVALEL